MQGLQFRFSSNQVTKQKNFNKRLFSSTGLSTDLKITNWTYETIFLRLFLLPINVLNKVSSWRVIISIYSLSETVKYINFGQITYDDFTFWWISWFYILQVMYKNYCHKQLAKITTCMKYLIDDRYISPFCFGNLYSRDYHGDFLNVIFSSFLTFSYRSPWCFRMFLRMFVRFPSVFCLFPLSVSPVSYFRFPFSWHPFTLIKNDVLFSTTFLDTGNILKNNFSC